MISVKIKPEPETFDDTVRQPGKGFLETVPAEKKVDYTNREYWRRCIPDLMSAYSNICAYTSTYIEKVTGFGSVEHFLSKDDHREYAYEWSNFRLVCGRMNGRKGKEVGLVDPFSMPTELFELDIPGALIRVWKADSDEQRQSAEKTIRVLKLNDEMCIEHRLTWLTEYANSHVDADYVARRAPFVHRELVRKGLSPDKVLQMLSPAV